MFCQNVAQVFDVHKFTEADLFYTDLTLFAGLQPMPLTLCMLSIVVVC